MRSPARLAALVLLAAAARAAPPDELFDGLKYYEYDLYDYTPEEQAGWEAGRYAKQAVRIEDGSVTLREVQATLEGQANFFTGGWMDWHLDVRDDRTREAEVARFSADLLVHASESLSVGISGSPDVLKDGSAWGLAALLHSPDRTSYAVARVLQDRPLYNLKNLEGGHRQQPFVGRGQLEARLARGPLSGWGRIDLGMPARYDFPSAPPEGVQAKSDYRSEGEAHLRWKPSSSAAIGLRFTARRLDGSQTSALAPNELRRGIAFARAYALVPLAPALWFRAVALYVEERAKGQDAGLPYSFSRRDLGVRGSAVMSIAPVTFEAGYGAVHSQQALSAAGPPGAFNPDWWGDKAFIMAGLRIGPATARLLVSHQLLSGRFGGLGGSLLAVF